MTSSTDVFRAARDLLLAHRSDYDTARREFAWPDLEEFNWALDWFDAIAAEHPVELVEFGPGELAPRGLVVGPVSQQQVPRRAERVRR